tara:strand:- start:42549 stop:42839 length:291 start_codon:yes stop_codon:yes gene_type:complete
MLTTDAYTLATSQLLHVVTDGALANIQKMLPGGYVAAKLSMGNILIQFRETFNFFEPSLGQITITSDGEGGFRMDCSANTANNEAWLEALIFGVTG